VLKFISELVRTSKTFLAKGDIFLASDISLLLFLGTVYPISYLKPMKGLRANMVSDVIEFSTNQKTVNFFGFLMISR